MKKIVLITPLLQTYRITFYEKLSKYDPNLDWVIYHGVQNVEYGKLDFKGKTSFENVGFQKLKYRIGPYTMLINKGMYRAIVQLNPDLIILQSITGNITYRKIIRWARRNNKPIILWTCGWDPGNAKGVFLKFKNYLASSVFKNADFHLTYSTNASKYTENMGVAASMIQTCYNGIEIDQILKDELSIIERSKILRHRYELDGYFSFLYVGGLLPQKKLDLLLDAFSVLRKKYSKIKLLIIGDGPLKPDLLGKLKDLKDENIYYLGRIVQDSDDYFAAIDCLVMPGTGGLALNQAMFWRKINIVGEADGTEDDLIIDGKTGLRFEKDNMNSLINAMERSISMPQEKIKQMGEDARAIILNRSNVNYMVDVFASKVLNLLSEK